MKKMFVSLMCAVAFCFAQTENENVDQVEEIQSAEQVESTENAVEETSVETASDALVVPRQYDYNTVDSLQIYNDLVEKFERRGNKIRKPATPLIVAGSIALGVGLVTAVVGEVVVASSCDTYDDYCDADAADGVVLYVVGDLLATAGALSLATGITLKIVGGTQLKRARMYRKKAEEFERRQNAAFLRVVPTVDPINGRVGTLAMLNF